VNGASAAGFDWRRFGRIIAIIAGVVIFVYVLTLIPKTVEVFVLAAFIAFGVNPVVLRWSTRMPRLLAISLVYLALLAIVVVAALIIVPDTINQLQAVFANGSQYADDAQRLFLRVEYWVEARFRAHVLPPQFQDIERNTLDQASAWAQNALGSVSNFVVGIASAVLVGVAAIFLSYYLLANAADIRTFYYSLFPQRSRPAAHAFAHEVARIFGGYMIGNGLLFAFTAAATFAVLAIIHSQYALLLGIVTGLLYLVPYLGLLVAIIVGMALGLLQGWEFSLLTGGVIIGVTRISDYVIAPKVMGESVGVSPVTIIFALFAGGELFGLWGLLLAIPAAGIIKVVWTLWLRPWLTGEPAPLPELGEHVSGAAAPAAAVVPSPTT